MNPRKIARLKEILRAKEDAHQIVNRILAGLSATRGTGGVQANQALREELQRVLTNGQEYNTT
jgi:hypothetical protein